MKREFVSILLAALLLLLAACGAETTQETTGETGVTQEEIIESNAAETAETQAQETISFTELVVADNEECTLKITGIETDSIWGFTLNVQMENKSSDKTYMFAAQSAAINGVMCDPVFATEVAAGKKANDDIIFTDTALEENGITDYTDIEISFRVYDSNDWTADDVVEETVHVYPYGEENATVFVREAQESDNIILDNDNVTVIVLSYTEDEIWGYTVNLFLQNKTEDEVMFSIDEASVNGYMADPYYATSVSGGKCAFSSVSWYNSTLEENGITVVEEIEFLLQAHTSEDWTELASQVITLNP